MNREADLDGILSSLRLIVHRSSAIRDSLDKASGPDSGPKSVSD
jgi:hypothetical protein